MDFSWTDEQEIWRKTVRYSNHKEGGLYVKRILGSRNRNKTFE